MRIGDLTDRITLLSPQRSNDDSGAEIRTFVPQGTPWAAVRAKSGREGWAADQRYATVTTVFWIRHRADVTPEWRVQHDGVDHDVVAVLPVQRPRKTWVRLLCVARAE